MKTLSSNNHTCLFKEKFLNKDLLSTNHILAVGRQADFFCIFLNKDLLKTHHILAVGRQVQIPRRFRNRDLLRKSHVPIVGPRSRGIDNSHGKPQLALTAVFLAPKN